MKSINTANLTQEKLVNIIKETTGQGWEIEILKNLNLKISLLGKCSF